MTVTVVDAGAAHAEIVAALHGATMGADDGSVWGDQWVTRILSLPGTAAALALAPDPVGPIGFALCLPAGEAFDLAAIGVLAEHRRGGIGRALLARMAEKARAAGAARLMLEVADDNAAALGFYRKEGFAEAGRRRAYYRARPGGAPRDALILSRPL